MAAIQTETTTSAHAALERFFTHFGAGDRAAVVSLFAPTVDWNVPGSPEVPWTGRRSTPAEVDAFLATAAAEVETTESFAVDRILADGQDAVAFGSFVHVIRSTGKRFSSEFALRVAADEQGRIKLYHMFENAHAAAEAFTA